MFYSLGLYNIYKNTFNKKNSYWRIIKNPLKLNIPFARSDFLFARTEKMEYIFFLYIWSLVTYLLMGIKTHFIINS
jgi:hypothetical protein